MSKAVSALNGASFEGYVSVQELGPQGMITVRGDHASVDVKNAVTGVTGLDFPQQRRIGRVGDQGLAWMSPDELLVLVPYESAPQVAQTMTEHLGSTHSLVANVSDARAMFRLQGHAVREVLAKLVPADMSPEALPVGEIRRTRAAQVAVAFWLVDDTTAELVCFRSVARYVFDILSSSAKSGSEVGLF